MAYTFAQRYNLRKRLPISDPVEFVDKCLEGLRKVAQDYIDGDLTITDQYIVASGKTVNQAQLDEWCFRALRGQLDEITVPMMLDKNNFPADPAEATDVQIAVSVRRTVGPFASKIGTGSF